MARHANHESAEATLAETEPSTPKPDAPVIGTIVHYSGQDGAVHPAIVTRINDDGTADLHVFMNYAEGTADRAARAPSDGGELGTWMPMMDPKDREEKIKAAAQKRQAEEEKQAEEVKRQQDERKEEELQAWAKEQAAKDAARREAFQRYHTGYSPTNTQDLEQERKEQHRRA